MHAHEKIGLVSLEAVGLWTLAGSWSGDRGTNGFIPRAILPKLAPGRSTEELDRLAGELVAAKIDGLHDYGLWEDRQNGWQFHDWPLYQAIPGEPPEEKKKRISSLRRAAGKKGAAARWQPVPSSGKSHHSTGTVRNGSGLESGSDLESSKSSETVARGEQEPGQNGHPTTLKAQEYVHDPTRAVMQYGPPESWFEVTAANDAFRAVYPAAGKLRARDTRAVVIVERFAQGFSIEQLAEAARGSALDPHISSNAQFQTVTTVWKDAERVDKFIALLKTPPKANGKHESNAERTSRENREYIERAEREEREGTST
jgi:hypothetical protein